MRPYSSPGIIRTMKFRGTDGQDLRENRNANVILVGRREKGGNLETKAWSGERASGGGRCGLNWPGSK
jgi:hypothetical protein